MELFKWSRFAMPCMSTRKELVLPQTFPTMKSSKSVPLKHNNSWKSAVANMLSVSLLDDVVDTLLTDVNAWATSFDLEHDARWIAERLLIWLYDLGVTNTLQVQELEKEFKEAEKIELQFLELTHLPKQLNAPVFEIAKPLSVWTALKAFNSFRFRMETAMETFQIAARHAEPECTKADNTAMCEAFLICATRAREHAVFGVFAALKKILEQAPRNSIPTALGVQRRHLESKSKANENLLDVLALVKVLLSSLSFMRVKLNDTTSLGQDLAAEIIRQLSLWSLNHGPSLFAVTCCENEELCKAVARVEAASIVEGHALSVLSFSNDFIQMYTSEEEPKHHFFRKSFLKLNLALRSETFDIWKGVSELDKLRVLSVFENNNSLIEPTVQSFSAFQAVYALWKQTEQDSMHTLCRMLVDVNAYKVWLKLVQPELVAKLQWQIVLDRSLRSFLQTMKFEDKQRLTTSRENFHEKTLDVFEGVQFSIPQVEHVLQVAKKRQWTWI